MKVLIAGLWHLGCVTAACLAKIGHEVIAYDPDEFLVSQLQQGITPVHEPGLDALLQQENVTRTLSYTTNPKSAAYCDCIWITFDTPVNDDDSAEIDTVIQQIQLLLTYVQQPKTLLIISSQLPVGTTRQMQQHHNVPGITFAYIPENLRLGKAIDVFTHPDRIVVGLQTTDDKEKIKQLLGHYTDHFIWMSIESAEMTKHALNAFLATSVVFTNELASLCEQVGASSIEVEIGLKSEERIGQKAYLRAGHAIAGGTLMRDVHYLKNIGTHYQLSTPLFNSLPESNNIHKQWVCQKIKTILQDIQNKKIAVLGLTYKPGTNTLRRSHAIETCRWLAKQGAIVTAYDPALTTLPANLATEIDFSIDLEKTLQTVDATIIATECPEFKTLSADQLIAIVKQPLVFDPSGFLKEKLGHDSRICYFHVGSPLCH